jgi:KDO2-lipid IV(A) lauroyltransferase
MLNNLATFQGSPLLRVGCVFVDIQRFLNSRSSIVLALFLGRTLPRRVGYRLADWIATRLAARSDLLLVQTERANQWVVSGETLAGEALNWAVEETLRNTARSIFDFYHYFSRPEATQRLIIPEANAELLLQRTEYEERGLVIAGLHMSAFDLVLQSLCRQGMHPLVLTIPDPQGGRQQEYEMRRRTGMNILPASVSALRQAVRHLQQGGMVVTGIDRPIKQPSHRPRFFGRPAALPTHHIYLALKAKVPIVIMTPQRDVDGNYRIYASELLEMGPHPDRETETLRNAEKVLSAAEGLLRKAPHQWYISLPVWPEIVGRV